MKACVVRHIDTDKFYKFTVGELGDIIITDKEEYDIDKLIVSIMDLEEVQHLNNDYYVVVRDDYGKHDSR
jgi:hypothetical protein